MKFMFAFAAALLWQSASYAAEPADRQDPLAADRAVAKQLGSELKAALTAALSRSPETAIGVCNEEAPQIAARLARGHDVSVGRTALRVRNPANAPSDWQRAVLEQFEAQLRDGASIANLEYSATVNTAAGAEQRYMKAIPTEDLCVVCHGTQIAPSLQQAIRTRYPADAAVGFRPGDLRGAVYVVRRKADGG